MTIADYILAFLSRGPATKTGLLGMLLGRGMKYAPAEIELGQALMSLVKCGRIESFGGMDCWRLTEKSCGAKDDKAEDPKPKTIAGYRNYSKEEGTPRTGTPGLTETGE